MDVSNGAAELIEEVSEGKITGEEDRYSKTDLWDFDANLQGSQAAVDKLSPRWRKPMPPCLARSQRVSPRSSTPCGRCAGATAGCCSAPRTRSTHRRGARGHGHAAGPRRAEGADRRTIRESVAGGGSAEAVVTGRPRRTGHLSPRCLSPGRWVPALRRRRCGVGRVTRRAKSPPAAPHPSIHSVRGRTPNRDHRITDPRTGSGGVVQRSVERPRPVCRSTLRKLTEEIRGLMAASRRRRETRNTRPSTRGSSARIRRRTTSRSWSASGRRCSTSASAWPIASRRNCSPCRSWPTTGWIRSCRMANLDHFEAGYNDTVQFALRQLMRRTRSDLVLRWMVNGYARGIGAGQASGRRPHETCWASRTERRTST